MEIGIANDVIWNLTKNTNLCLTGRDIQSINEVLGNIKRNLERKHIEYVNITSQWIEILQQPSNKIVYIVDGNIIEKSMQFIINLVNNVYQKDNDNSFIIINLDPEKMDFSNKFMVIDIDKSNNCIVKKLCD